MPVVKKSVSLPEEIVKSVENFPSRIRGTTEFSTKVQEMIEDLTKLIARVRKLIEPLFAENEFNYLKDLLNSSILTPDLSYKTMLLASIEDANIYENLAYKWQINAEELTAKIKSLSEFECYVLVKIIDEFWNQNI